MERGWLGGMNGDGERISGRCVGGIFPYNGLQIWTRRVNKARHGAKLGLDRLTVGDPVWPDFVDPELREKQRTVSRVTK